MPLSWNELIERYKNIGDRMVAKTWNGDSELSRQETFRALMTAHAQGLLNMVHSDPDHPDWTPLLNNVLNLAAPNPDFLYYYSALRPGGTYKICGYRGTSLFVYINQGRDMYPTTRKPGPALDGLDIDTLHIGEGGYFEVLLSPERPANYVGDWWRLHPEANYVAARQASYDWRNEIDARFAIDRLDAPAVPTRLSTEEIGERLAKLSEWIENAVVLWYEHMNATRTKNVVNRLEVYDYSGIGGFAGQIYLEGIYELETDEALILETDIPEKSFYWSFLVTDDQFSTVDYVNRQSSLNPKQIRVDSDGKFRAVISAQDPGVPNWLDNGGYRSGMIQGRWNQCSSAPVPTLTRVKLADVRSHLPKDTPTITPAERDTALRERRIGAQLRRRW